MAIATGGAVSYDVLSGFLLQGMLMLLGRKIMCILGPWLVFAGLQAVFCYFKNATVTDV